MENSNRTSRRKFIQHSALAGASVLLAGPLNVFAQNNGSIVGAVNIKSVGFAGVITLNIL